MPDEVVPAVTPPAPAASPWAADAATYFGDNADAIAGFDRYMREKQQPYVTQLEESSAEAREYYKDLQEDTDATLRLLIGQRYGDEFAAEFDGLFTPAAPVAEPPPSPAEVTAPPALGAEDAELLEWARTKRDAEQVDLKAQEYSNFKAELKTEHNLTDDDLEIIDPFIAVNPDAASAIQAFRAWQARAGVAPAPEAEQPAPPPVLGDGNPNPPLATKYTRWEDRGSALKNFLATQASSNTPPPVVG